MIEPAIGGLGGVRATAEPGRDTDAEQNQFAAVLGDHAAIAQRQAHLAQQRMLGAFPAGIAATTGRELATAGPTKATVAAALEEQVSPGEKMEAPATRREALAGNGGNPGGAPAMRPEHHRPAIPNQQPQARPDSAAAPSAQRLAQPAHPSHKAATAKPAAPATPGLPAREGVAVGSAMRTSAPVMASRQGGPPQAPLAAVGRGQLDAATSRLRPSPTAAPPRETNPQTQFARGLAAALRQGGGSVMLHLKPEQLGDLKVRMDIRGGSVAAEFHVRTKEARGLLQETLDMLRTVLEAKGLEVERLSVHLAERKGEHAAQDAPPQDAGDSGEDRHGGHGPPDERDRAARMPRMEAGMEVLELPETCAELHAGLGGVPRIDAIA